MSITVKLVDAKRANQKKRRYAVFFADDDHYPIRDLRAIRLGYGGVMALRCNSIPVGHIGIYKIYNRKITYLHTDGSEIYRGCRRKGHGIVLYMRAIQLVRRMGAERLYSGRHLNKYSSRMWRVKLAKHFDVKHVGGICKHPCRHCHQNRGRFYIDL